MKDGRFRQNVDAECAFCSGNTATDESSCVDAMRLTDIGEWMGISADVFRKNFEKKEACAKCADKVWIFESGVYRFPTD